MTNIYGKENTNDRLVGTEFDDLIFGLSGNDTLFGGTGNDTLIGGTGNDVYDLTALAYYSSVELQENPGAGTDSVLTASGFQFSGETLAENIENVYVVGNDYSNVTVTGNQLDNRLYGSVRDNLLRGLEGNDYLDGNYGNDALIGDDGNDTLVGGKGNDSLSGGAGADTFVFSKGFGVDTVTDVTSQGFAALNIIKFTDYKTTDAVLTRQHDHLIVDFVNGYDKLVLENFFQNLGGSDVETVQLLFADGTLQQNDILSRLLATTADEDDAGDELVAFAGRAHTMAGEEGNDTLYGAELNDVIAGASGSDRLYGQEGNDKLYGNANGDLLQGGMGNDSLYGGSGNDTLMGEDNRDYLYGDTGNDTLWGGGGADTFEFRKGFGHDIVMDLTASNAGITQDVNTIKLGDFRLDNGSQGSDVRFMRLKDDWNGEGDDLLIRFNTSTDELRIRNFFQQDGTDLESANFVFADGVLTAEQIRQKVLLHNGTQALDAQNDLGVTMDAIGANSGAQLTGGAGNDTLWGSSGGDALTGGAGDDTLHSLAGYDTLSGGDGNDRLVVTGSGRKTLEGGAGSDVFDLRGPLGRQDSDYMIGDISQSASGDIDTLRLDQQTADLVWWREDTSLHLQYRNTDPKNTYGFNAPSITVKSFFDVEGAVASSATFEFADQSLSAQDLVSRLLQKTNQYTERYELYDYENLPQTTYLSNGQFYYVTANGGNDIVLASNPDAQAYMDLGEGNDSAMGGSWSDHIVGANGNDTLQGGKAADLLEGGAGADRYNYAKGDGLDTLVETDEGTTVVNKVFVSGYKSTDVAITREDYTLVLRFKDSLGALTTDGIRLENFVNTTTQVSFVFSDNITLTTANLIARISAMTATGVTASGNGNDLVYLQNSLGSGFSGNAGNDTIIGSLEGDQIFGESGNDRLSAGPLKFADQVVHDGLYGGDGADTLIGANSQYATQYLSGDAGNDRIEAGRAADTIDGGAGSDVYLFKADFGHDEILMGYGSSAVYDTLDLSFLQSSAVQLSRQGNDLRIAVPNSDDLIEVRDYFSSNSSQEQLRINFANETLDQSGVMRKLPIAYGTDDGERLNAHPFSGNTLYAGAGDDTLYGNSYGDKLYGQDDEDQLYGGNGNDTLDGGTSGDYLSGDAGADSLIGGLGQDSLYGGDGNDQLSGGTGHDYLEGGKGSDIFRFDRNFGQDIVKGDDGYNEDPTATLLDTLDMRSHLLGELEFTRAFDNLLIKVINTADKIEIQNYFSRYAYAVDNYDKLQLQTQDALLSKDALLAHIKLTLLSELDDTFNGLQDQINKIYAGFGEDTVMGGNASDQLYGEDGNDSLSGGAGNDLLNGGNGNDTLLGGIGNDTYVVNNGADVTRDETGGGIDLVQASVNYTLGATSNIENLLLLTGAVSGTGNALANVLTGNAASNTLNGADGNDKADGGAGNDSLIGGNGNDTLIGGIGTDTLNGGAGNDTYSIDVGTDIVTGETTTSGIDLVQASVNYTLGATSNLENLLLLTGAVSGTGNALANVLTGNAASNTLNGADGNDKADGGAGNDSLIGGNGNDTLIGGIGSDALTGGLGNDIFDFNTLLETGLSDTTWDVIADFVKGSDKIDLSTLDADATTAATNEAFTLIASNAAFSTAGQVRVSNEMLYGNTDGDSDAEFAIKLTGIGSLSGTDLIL